MAIVLVIQKWWHYLLGRIFIVHIDQKSLKFLVEQPMMGQEQQKWMAKLLGYEFEIIHKAGKENRAADALSRQHYFGAISSVTFQDCERSEEEVQQDSKLQGIMQDLLHGGEVLEGFQLKGGRLYYKDRVVVPKNSPKIPLILQEFHDTAMGGHSGFFRTYKRVSGLLWWEGMKKTIQQYVQQCEVCNRNKHQTLSPVGLL